MQRLEHEVAVSGPAGQRPVLDLQRHAGTGAGAALAAALQTAPGAALEERHATDVQRLHCLMVTEGGCQVEAALDVGQALAGGLQERFVELELEHKGGPLQGLFDLATACVKHGGLWQSTVTKAERGERLRQAALQASGQMAPGAAQPQALEQALEKALESLLVSASALAAPGVDDALVKQPAFQTALLALQALAHGRHAVP